MKVTIKRWDYPRAIDEGLEKEKRWYEFQLVENREIEMTNEEVAQIICDEGERGRSLVDTPNGSFLDAGDTTYLFYFE